MAEHNNKSAVIELYDGWRSKQNGPVWRRSLLLYASDGTPKYLEPALRKAVQRAKANLEKSKSAYWWRSMVVGRLLIKEGDQTKEHPLRVFPAFNRTRSGYLYRLYLGPKNGQWRISGYAVRYGDGKLLESLQPLKPAKSADQAEA